jgi:beta-lactamase regulating signal transducer with metallopeptidase domain
MMFYALVISVCLSALFLVMAGASLVCLPLHRLLRPAILRMAGSEAPATAANLLFAMRTLPLLLALGVTLGFALPAFLKFEPRATSEVMNVKLLLLAVAGALILTVMALRGARVLRVTARAERRWRINCDEQQANVSGSKVPLYRVDQASSLLVVTGFFRPRIFVGREVVRTFSSDELSAALAHEMAHVSFFDNLKQLLLKMTRLPRWLDETRDEDLAWANASEVAADQAALAKGASALDLAMALVKMGALKRGPAAGDQVAASHLLPDVPASALELRVTRLQKVLEGELDCSEIKSGRKPWRTLCAVAVPTLAYVAGVNALLPAIYRAMEFLVR